MSNSNQQIKNLMESETKKNWFSDELLKTQEKLSNISVSGISGVEDEDEIYAKITLNALQQIEKIQIGDGAISSGAKVTAALVKAAYDDALEKLKAIFQKEMMKNYQDSNL